MVKNILQPLVRKLLIPILLTAEQSGANAEIHRKVLGCGISGLVTTTRITSNGEMIDLMKIVKSSEDSGLLLKGVTKATKNKTKNKEEDFLLRYKILWVLDLLKNLLSRID